MQSAVRLDRFSTVSLHFPSQFMPFNPASARARTIPLLDLLQHYTSQERVEGVKCSYCTAKATVAKIDDKIGVS